MWDRASRGTREAREFAAAHDLAFHGDAAPGLPASLSAHPFEHEQRRHCVSGEWRGRAVQRFMTTEITVELMALRGLLPLLHVIPSGLERGALEVGGRAVATGDPAFDSHWTVLADDASFAAAFLTASVREALMHPAAAGRAFVVDGMAMYTWVAGESPWGEARVRFEFLSVIAGRIDPAVWAQFVVTPRVEEPRADAAWVPGDATTEEPMWAVAPLPQHQQPVEGTLSDTGEFEVALLNAELESTTFLPGPAVPTSEYGSWVMAPEVSA